MTGFAQLLHLQLRTGRVWWPVWILALSVQVPMTASAYDAMYTEEAGRAPLLVMGEDPTLTGMYGPAYDLMTTGGFTTWRAGMFAGVFVAVMTILSVVRGTRADEESGRLELVRAGVCGRFAPTAAALASSCGAALAVGLLVGGGMAALGTGVTGSLVLASGIVLVGWVFAGVAAVCVQLASSARGARGTALLVLATSYLLRAVGDVAGEGSPVRALSLLSPLGWMTHTAAYAQNRWWPLVALAALAAALVAVAYLLQARRDFGAGLLPDRPGPAYASASLRGPLALAWRQHRQTLLVWAVVLGVFSAGCATLSRSITDLMEGNEQTTEIVRRMGGAGALQDAFFGMIVPWLAVVVGLYCALTVAHLRAEETEGRAELLLAADPRRSRLLGAQVLVGFGGAVLLLAVMAACFVVSAGFATGIWSRTGALLEACVAQVPAALAFGALATALLGWAPRLVALAAALWGAGMALVMLGALLDLPAWVLKLPPALFVTDDTGGVRWWAAAVLTALSLVLAAAGFVGFRRRNVPA